MADELVRSRSVIGLLDGGLRLWVVSRPALVQIIMLSGLVLGLASLGVPVDRDFSGPIRLSLLIAMLIIGEAAGAATFRHLLDGEKLAAKDTRRAIRRHWLGIVSAWAGSSAVGTIVVWLATGQTWPVWVLLWTGFALILSLVSLLLVTAIVEQSGIGTVSRLLSLTKGFKGKLLGLALLWGLAVGVFAVLMAGWLVLLTLLIFSSALGPLQIDFESWDPDRWTTMVAVLPLMIFAPGSAGVWGLFLVDLSVQREGLDLTRGLSEIDQLQ